MTAEKRVSNVQRLEKYAAGLGEGVPLPSNKVIAEALGLKDKQVGAAVSKSRKQTLRKIPPALNDNSFTRRNNSIMVARGNIWPDIKPYGQMGMRAKEIHIALVLEKDREIGTDSITWSLIDRRRRHQLPGISADEKTNAFKTLLRATDEEIRVRDIIWLALRDYLITTGVDISGYRRLNWMGLIENNKYPIQAPLMNSTPGFVAIPTKAVLDEKAIINQAVPIDPRQISFEQYEHNLIIREQLTNLSLFSAKLAKLALVVGWSPQTNQKAVAGTLKEKGVNVLGEVREVVNRVGFAVDKTIFGSVFGHGFSMPEKEGQISELEYLRYATYFLILVNLGLEIPEDPLSIPVSEYQKKIIGLLKADIDNQTAMRTWAVQLEGLIKNLKSKS